MNITNFSDSLNVYKKPDTLVINDIHWKYLIRSVLKGKNILIVGPTGSGKTSAATSAVDVLNRTDKFFRFNLGSMQDARSSLIGNTHYEKDTGTIFSESTFVRAIQTEDSIVLLDELSRASHDAINILMTVLDDVQRYLRLDEKKTSDIIKVVKGVTFIATANIGNEYTATRIMDRALLNRFSVKVEMNPIDKDEEINLMKVKFNNFGNDKDKLKLLEDVIDIAVHTRQESSKDGGKLTDFISTRSVVEMSELIVDGFSLLEICECVILPIFSCDGGVDSERTYMKQLIQKYIPGDGVSNNLYQN